MIVGGVDSLCQLTLQGFAALEAVSAGLCQPFSANRDGINIGEAAALFVMQRGNSGIALLGGGASSDAHHMSAPQPKGLGAIAAINQACQRAGISAQQLDYINLHGTATALNDSMESAALAALGLVLLDDPRAVANPFYMSAPDWAQVRALSGRDAWGVLRDGTLWIARVFQNRIEWRRSNSTKPLVGPPMQDPILPIQEMDRQILSGYRLFPVHYLAYAMWADRDPELAVPSAADVFPAEELSAAKSEWLRRLANCPSEQQPYLILQYANPVRNQYRIKAGLPL